MLGEKVANESEMSTISQIIELGRVRVSSTFTSSSDLLNAPRTQSKRTCDIMRFYHQLVMAAFTKGNTRTGRTRGLLCAYYLSRWVSFCINKKAVCIILKSKDQRKMLEENLNDNNSDGLSGQSKVLEGKALILVNMSKFVVEIVGTAVLGIFYLLMGDK